MIEKKRYVVRICGKEYALMSDDSQEHVFAAAQRVDELVSSIAHKSSSIDSEKVAILVALRLASDLLKLQEQSTGISLRHEAMLEAITQELLA